jgi:hypothetical protein
VAEQGRVRWKRFILIFAPVATMTSLLIGATAQGVISATFVVSGDSFKLYTGELRGQGFALTGGVVHDKKGHVIPVIPLGVRRAIATDLCQSVLMKTPLGSVTFRLTGGQGGNEVTVNNLVIDVAAWQSAALLRDIEMGRDASTLDEVPGVAGPAGAFGGQGRTITIRDVRIAARAVTASTFSLPDLGLKAVRGEHECF